MSQVFIAVYNRTPTNSLERYRAAWARTIPYCSAHGITRQQWEYTVSSHSRHPAARTGATPPRRLRFSSQLEDNL